MSAISGASRPQAQLIVTEDGQYLLQGTALNIAELDIALRKLKDVEPNVDLHVVGSPKVKYEQVAPAMNLVQRHGLGKIGVLVDSRPDHDIPR